MLEDGGYTGQTVADGVTERIAATVEVVKRKELHAFVVQPQRGIVERSRAGAEKCAGSGKTANEKLYQPALHTGLQMLHSALLRLLLGRS